jgi:hypothetical protein
VAAAALLGAAAQSCLADVPITRASSPCGVAYWEMEVAEAGKKTAIGFARPDFKLTEAPG